jgi:hypothetical protein
MSNFITILFFSIWILVGLLTIAFFRTRKTKSVGLTFIFFGMLAQRYGLAPMIYIVDTTSSNSEPALRGYPYATLAIAFFGIGILFSATLFNRNKVDIHADSGVLPAYPTAAIYITLSLASLFFLTLPLPQSFLGSMWGLLPLGLILLLWKFWNMRQYTRIVLLCLVIIPLPLITGFFSGFIGDGSLVLISVFAFVFILLHFPWHAIFWGAVVAYVSLSMVASFIPIKEDVRGITWANSSALTRAQLFSTYVSNIQLFDPRNQAHFEYVDGRLNQNYVTGVGIEYMSTNNIPFSNCDLVRQAVVGLVPRAIWPNKPIITGGHEPVSFYTGLDFADGTSVGLGYVFELYINFGTLGVALGFLLLGLFIATMDHLAAVALANNKITCFGIFYLSGLAFYNVEDNLITAIVGAVISAILIIAFNRLLNIFFNLVGSSQVKPTRFKSVPKG